VRRRYLRSVDQREPSASDPDYLADALDRLSMKRRAMVALRFYEQRTGDEIAKILQTPPDRPNPGCREH